MGVMGGARGIVLLALLPFTAAQALLPHTPVQAGELPVFADRLPSSPISCPLTGGQVRPEELLAGKPAVLFFMDNPAGLRGDLARFLAELQTEFAPWLSWVGILVGPGTADDARRFESDSPLRFSRCASDRDGEWKAAFGLTSLPAAVLINERGYVVRRQYGLPRQDVPGILRDVARLVGAGKLVGRPAFDFKVREVGTGAEKTLADLVGRDYTLLLSLRSDCTSCLEELQALNRFRGRYPAQVTLVVVYHDQLQEPRLVSGQLPPAPRPDFELWDQGLSYADRYSVNGVPFLVVTDRGGTVALARTGFDPESAGSVEEELDRLLGRLPAGKKDAAAFLEYLRIREEALAFLREGNSVMAVFFLERALELNPEYFTLGSLLAEAYLGCGRRAEAVQAYRRYLAADPQACDREKIERRITALAAVGAQP